MEAVEAGAAPQEGGRLFPESSSARVLLIGTIYAFVLAWLASLAFGVPALQVALAAVVVAVLGWAYGRRSGSRFGRPMARYFHDNLIQGLLLALVIGMAWGLVGSSYGIPDLIWSERAAERLASAVGMSVTLALLGINAYYLDPDPDSTREVIASFRERHGIAPRFGSFLEPKKARGRDLSLFLRTVRLPFLTMVALPALFPLAFESVPRLAPGPGWEATGPGADVTRSAGAYLSGVVLWVGGLVLGVLLVKLALVVGDRLTEFTDPVAGALETVARTFRSEAASLGRGLSRKIGAAWDRVNRIWSGMLPPGELRRADPGGHDPGVEPGPAGPPAAITTADLAEAGGSSAPTPGAAGSVRSGVVVVAVPAPAAGASSQTQALFSFVVVFAIFFLAFSTFAYGLASTGQALFALIGVLAMANALFRRLIRARWRAATLGLALLWIAWANSSLFKLQFENLAYDERTRDRLLWHDPRFEEAAQAEVGPAVPDPMPGLRLVDGQEVMDNWRARFGAERPKLAIVCSSGGGTRAGLWSAAVLGWLDDELAEEGFRRSLRLISAGSAGAMGTGHYVKWAYDHTPLTLTPESRRLIDGEGSPERVGVAPRWFEKVPRDSLRPVARSIALREFWRMFTPGAGLLANDRGKELEDTWDHLRELTLEELREAERRALIPSMVLSPVILEDGRRLLISNLDLATHARPGAGQTVPAVRDLSIHRGRELIFAAEPRTSVLEEDGDRPDHRAVVDLIGGVERGLELLPEPPRGGTGPADLRGPARAVFSVTGIEFSKLFRREKGFRMATAARMAATSPFLTPAVYLPTRPAVRVIASGYRDDYGVNLTASWIFQNREWIRSNTSGVVLIQIRAMNGDPEGRLSVPEWTGPRLAPGKGYQLLSSVAEGAANASSSGAMFRNDREVALLSDLLNRAGGTPGFFTTVVFELPALVRNLPGPERWPAADLPEDWHDWDVRVAPLSWYLTGSQARAIQRGALIGRAEATRLGMDGLARRGDRRKRLDRLRDRLAEVGDDGSRPPVLWEYERALNYERLQSLRAWWARDHNPSIPGPAVTRGRAGEGPRP